MIWIILASLGVCVLAIVLTSTFAVGIQEASDPTHSKAENLSKLEKNLVNRNGTNSADLDRSKTAL